LAVIARSGLQGEEIAERIVAASELATADPYRAATHNKGVMNGIDAVVLATGNDWRAVEAGAHAYACRDGGYRALSTWTRDGDALVGRLELPMALSTVGPGARLHPTAGLALRLLGASSARDLARVVAAVGLASNLAALHVLCTEGIQRGHMGLHRRGVSFAERAVQGEGCHALRD
jgi:hydroxymethylglutaryl-CoA reductase